MRTVRTITPSWLIKNKSDFTRGVKTLIGLGFNVLNPRILAKLPSPKQKAAEINSAFRDPNVDIILAQRGGYSSLKVLPFIDFRNIKKNPRIFAGFSDISTLLNAIYERTGLVTFHSPMVINLGKPSGFTLRSFLNAVNGFADRNLLKNAPIKVFKHGKAAGVLKGGNLVTITSLIGTDWDVRTKNTIVFLEDVDEEPHRIDRYLTQWILAGKFKGVRGVILGDFSGVKSDEVFKVLSSQMKVSFPVIHCPYIGHVKNKITLPVGAMVALDTQKKSLLIMPRLSFPNAGIGNPEQ